MDRRVLHLGALAAPGNPSRAASGGGIRWQQGLRRLLNSVLRQTYNGRS